MLWGLFCWWQNHLTASFQFRIWQHGVSPIEMRLADTLECFASITHSNTQVFLEYYSGGSLLPPRKTQVWCQQVSSDPQIASLALPCKRLAATFWPSPCLKWTEIEATYQICYRIRKLICGQLCKNYSRNLHKFTKSKKLPKSLKLYFCACCWLPSQKATKIPPDI